MGLFHLIKKPDRILEDGFIRGYEYIIAHNNLGYRCGYVLLPVDHPWYGLDYSKLDNVIVHGGLTFSEVN